MRLSIPLVILFGLAPACEAPVPDYTICHIGEPTHCYDLEVRMGVDSVWDCTRATLSRLSRTPIEVDEHLRTAIADIEDSAVTVRVEACDLQRSAIHLSALRRGAGDTTVATRVKDQILGDLDRLR